ncbi:MAG: glycoside hydrolase family 5 protein [Actinobacteria bacterium]|nr:glycoside hydrolase family 5 protein [Actinomycetota bacterium]
MAKPVVAHRSVSGAAQTMMRVLVAVVALAGIATACSATPTVPIASDSPVVDAPQPDLIGPIRLVGSQFVDGAGRTVIIHGLNSVEKSPPFLSEITPTRLGGADLDRITLDGFNGIRLGVWPAAVVPSPGVVDHDYVDRVREVVDRLADRGLWVLLDFHQDVFWGMPSWATTPAAAALSPDPPAGLDIGWAAAYASPRSTQQWDDWWANVPTAPGSPLGMVDAYAQGVAAVAARHVDAPNVIGVEVINEPYPGSALLACGLGGCPQLDTAATHVNTIVTTAVRAVAPDMPVWWTPQALFPVYSDTTMARPGPTGGAAGLSFHTYCAYTDGGEPTSPPPALSTICGGVFEQAFDRAENLARRWQGPALLTEFGASASPLNVTAPVRLADERLLSWFHWASGRYPEAVESQIVRPSAQATAGIPLSQQFDSTTGTYRFTFRPDPAVQAPTSIVIPGRVYPTGYVATVTGGTIISAEDSGRLLVEANNLDDDVEITVRRR